MFRFTHIYALLVLSLSSLAGQKDAFNLNVKNATFPEAFQELEATTSLRFSYSPDDVQDYRVTILLKGVDKEKLLKSLFKSTSLTYTLRDDNYVIVTDLRHLRDTLSLCGQVIDQLTGDPLPFANVYHNKSLIGTATDDRGNFSLNLMASKFDTVSISYVGYQSKKLLSQQLVNPRCPNIPLELSNEGDLFVLVTDYMTTGVDLSENGMSTEVNMKKVTALPGQIDGGALAMAKILPGVSSPTSKASDIHIRGTTPDQSLLLWEGIPIYNAAHYFDMVSTINPDIVDRPKVYRGGFGVEYGGRLGGIVEMSTDAIEDNGVIGAGLNLTNAYIYTRKRLFKSKELDFSFSLRRSFNELLKTPTITSIADVNEQSLFFGPKDLSDLPPEIEVNQDVEFLDGMAKISGKLTENDRLSVAGLYTSDTYRNRNLNRMEGNSQFDTIETVSSGMSLTWERKWNNRINTNLDLVSATYNREYDYLATPRDSSTEVKLFGFKKNSLTDRQVRFSTDYVNDEGQSFGMGYHMIYNDVDYNVFGKAGMDTNKIDVNTSGSHQSLFASFNNPINNVLGINAGLRASLFSINDSFYIEPRVQLSYRFNDELSSHVYYGMHHQYMAQVSSFPGSHHGIEVDLWTMAEEESFKVQNSQMIQLGTILNKRGWIFDLQSYYKKITGLNTRLFDIPSISDSMLTKGFVDVYGLDLMINKRFGNVNTWLSYSSSMVKYSLNNKNGNTYYADFDRPHVLSMVGQFHVRDLNFSIGVNYASGVPYSSVDSMILLNPDYMKKMEHPRFKLIYAENNDSRLDHTLEINAAVEYKYWPVDKSFSVTIAGSVTNAFARPNEYSRSYFVKGKMMNHFVTYVDETNLGFTPNLSVRLEFL